MGGAVVGEPEKRRSSPLRTVLEVVVIVVAAFAIAMLVQFFVMKPFTIHQVSMQPTIHDGERILVNRVIYHFRDPKKGDVMVDSRILGPVSKKAILGRAFAIYRPVNRWSGL